MKTYDIVIVGNGILGLSTAYALTLEDPYLKIAVIGPSHRKGGATLAAGAMLNCYSELNKCTLNSKSGQSKFNIARKALKMWPNWLDDLNETLDSSNKISVTPGTFMLLNARGGKRENENFKTILEALKTYKEPYEEVDCFDVPGINPTDHSRPLRALYLPNEGSLSPNRLIAGLEKAVLRNGQVSFIDDIATEIIIEKGQVVELKTKVSGSFSASRVLLAAGGFSQKLIDQIPALSPRIPRMFAARGCAITLKAQHSFKNSVRTPVRSGSCGIHILPYDEKKQLLYLGATNSIRFLPTFKPQARDIYFLLEQAMEQFSQELHAAQIIKWHVGNRPVSLDTFPLIGKTSVEGLWILTGTYRDGLHDSPLLGSSMAKELLGKSPLFQHEFQPERLPIEVMSKAETMLEYAEQHISSGYENAMKLPKTPFGLDIKNVAYKRIEFIYDALEVDFGVPIDVLVMLYWEPEKILLLKKYYQTIRNEFLSVPVVREKLVHAC